MRPMAYWDTSCLLKLYVPETDSGILRAHILTGRPVTTAEIARLELCAAAARKEAVQDLKTGSARQVLAIYDADVASGMVATRALDSIVVEKFEALIERCYL